MWTKDKREQLNELLAVILTGNYPAVILKEMNHLHLESIVTHLVLYSRRTDKVNYVDSKLSRPQWWPKHLKFRDPIKKLRFDIDKIKWSRILRCVVEHCSRFHKQTSYKLRKTVLATKLLRHSEALHFRKFKRKENHAIDQKKTHINNNNKHSKLRMNKDALNVYNKIPVVKLHDVVQQCKRKNIKLKLPLINLAPAVKLCDNRQVYKTQDKLISLPRNRSVKHPFVDSKLLLKAFVRLQDILRVPKQTECTKDAYMEYFKLGQTAQITSLSLTKHKPNTNKVFRNFNIPISSELGQMIMPTAVSNTNTLYKLQRLEWFLKESPQVKCEQEYPVTFTQRQNDSCWMHEYKFPKRQYCQMQQPSKEYYRLGICKPVCVKLERLDLQDLKNVSTS